MINLMKKYLSAFSVSGYETELAEIIKNDLSSVCDSIDIDAVGNVIAFKKGKDSSKKLMIASHMDEIGFMVVNIEESGMIRVAPIGGINAVASCFHNVRFKNGVSGILVVEDGTKFSDITPNKLFVDIGCDSAAKAKRKVKVGDVCAVAPMVKKLSTKRYAAKAHDDRVCCAISAYAALNCETPAYDTYFVFTVQEEVGCRGAKPSSFTVMPDYSIALDVTPAPAVGNPNHLTVKLGEGAAIKIKDSSVICSKLLVDRLADIAEEEKIKYQYEVLLAGGTDTSAMQIAGSGSHACCISLPTRYVHTPVETIDADDFKACVDLLIAFIEKGV
ncbi:MAG: M20/M25/M40 family metallo-hydrolase [Clostridia bacterium]|nr:M20/M25/M40 family metallo-hydrolase [Clostridia bacterium]MBQ9848608.1 M20/M25/M40 family metallo-hydrolase [Clostridia bacterium]